MRRAPHSQPNNLSATTTMHYFTPDSFFAATNQKQVHAKNGFADAMTTPKRPPKLMDQRIPVMATNNVDGRRNSQPKQQQPEFGQITPLNVVMPQLIKSPQQPPRNQTQQQQQMVPTMAMMGGRGGRAKGTKPVKETAKQMETTTTTIFATPPRRTTATTSNHRQQPQQQHSSIRREHSASIVIPSRRTLSATFMRYTPPTTIGMERGHSEVTALFAGSKSIESPSAKSLPLPPSHWLDSNRQQLAKQEIVEETMAEESDDADNAAPAPSSAEANNENFIPGTWSPPTASSGPTTTNGNKSPSGIRIHPLHLISAAVMSS